MTIGNVFILLCAFVPVSELAYNIEISYNVLNLSSCSKWDSNGITVVKASHQNVLLSNLFIDKKDNLYVTSDRASELYLWRNGSNSSVDMIYRISYIAKTLFVLSTNDIYLFGGIHGSVSKWEMISNTAETVTQFGRLCEEVFIAINSMIYCSMTSSHIIVTKSLYGNSSMITVVAGVGILGSESHMLGSPQGIFVSTNLDLYVADNYNNRILLFHPGQINGTIIPDTSDNFKLYDPYHVVLDANNQIYILERLNHRIIVKTHNGFRCLISCTGTGYSSDKLSGPKKMAFDSFGNIFVADSSNNRIQKFLLLKNKCDDIQTRTMSTMTTLTSTTVTATLIESVYEANITKHSPKFLINCGTSMRYYESVQMYIYKQGKYDFQINSTEGVVIYMHEKYFNPMDLTIDCFLTYALYCNICQIKFAINLQSNKTYQLSVTLLPESTMTSFSVTSIGPSNISFNQTNISIVETIYSSTLTIRSHKCDRDVSGLLDFYCEIFEITVAETGYYNIFGNSTIILNGYIYENNFTLLDLNINAININAKKGCRYNFPISLHRQMNTSFILIVTTKESNTLGAFSVIASGSGHVSIKSIENIPSIVESDYSSYLSDKSQKYDHLNCYYLSHYQAIKINVNTSDYYMFMSNSDIGTDGYLFEHYFAPYNSQETFLTKDEQLRHDEQFRFVAYLKHTITYILVLTTSFNEFVNQGAFTVIVRGPNRISMKQIGDIPPIVQSMHTLEFTRNDEIYGPENCHDQRYYYKSTQINVVQSGNYTLSLFSMQDSIGYFYAKHFNPYNPLETLHPHVTGSCFLKSFKATAYLWSNVTYIFVAAKDRTKKIMYDIMPILAFGPNNVTFKHITLQTTYTSELTKNNQVYSRVCGTGNYHYETVEINTQTNGSYTFDSKTSILLYGYIYESYFDPSYPKKNLISESNFTCGYHFQLGTYFQTNIKYILVVTTLEPNVRGAFTLLITGPDNATFTRVVNEHSNCVVGDQCNLYTKSIGLTINDILQNQIQPSVSFTKQSVLIQTAAGITMAMFFIGFINGIFSLLTFKNKELRNVGCGMYLLASSITSLLTIMMFTVKFWFVILIHLHSTVNSFILRADCAFIGPILKLCLYLDSWLNACIAIERTMNVSQGVTFDKKMSRRTARWLILVLPILIMGSIIHEPIRHELFEYTTQRYKSINGSSITSIENTIKDSFEVINEQHILCVIRYSASLQTYNTFTLYFHITIPFVANLCSALFIIFGTARRRSTAQTNKKTFKEHVVNQMSEHKQLLISPFVLLILTIPRLIMSLISGCVDPSKNPWLYLCGYFISYIPSMLIFIVFVLPSKLYMKTFKESITN